jgi:hypothetical protein
MELRAAGDREAPRRRSRVAALLAATAAAGLASRRWPLPGVLAEHTGDALYTVAVYLAGCLLWPNAAAGVLAAGAFALSAAVEVGQLLSPPWLVDVRSTRVGALLLGQGFQLADLAAYAAGAAVGWGADVTFRRASPAAARPPDSLP